MVDSFGDWAVGWELICECVAHREDGVETEAQSKSKDDLLGLQVRAACDSRHGASCESWSDLSVEQAGWRNMMRC